MPFFAVRYDKGRKVKYPSPLFVKLVIKYSLGNVRTSLHHFLDAGLSKEYDVYKFKDT